MSLLRDHRRAQLEQRLSLGAMYQDHDLIFCRENGVPLAPYRVQWRFKRFVRAANVPSTRLHDLRHLSATLMLRVGTHPKVASDRLGHATVAVTLNTYSHVTADLQQEAADALDPLLQGAFLRARSL